MVTMKSPREIHLMREAGRIVALAHRAVQPHILPGANTRMLNQIIEQTILSLGATPSFKHYNGFPDASCISINEQVVHGIPSKGAILKGGDIVSIDIGAKYHGYHGDSAWSYACGELSANHLALLEGTRSCLFKGLEQAKAGNHLSDISHAIQTYAEQLGFSVVRDFVGHGIGAQLHEDPPIPNYGPPGRGIVLKPGMTLAIEPMINLGCKEVQVQKDGWTTITLDHQPSAHFEHTILITAEGYEILTQVEDKEE